jgi:glutamate N-acetyltransferase/amino-acid N-acetyltransferase
MAISLHAPKHLHPISGVKLATVAAEIKYKKRDDLALIAICDTANTAVVLTRNQFCAAPVSIVREHLRLTKPKYLLINSGNANAGLGQHGIADAKQTCAMLATEAKCEIAEVLPFSTGVIGERLPIEKITSQIPTLLHNLSDHAWLDVAKAIMTTDTVIKGFSDQINLDGKAISITGITKGAGMIQPNMATMLAYVATDLKIDSISLNELLNEAVKKSFHCITVDGDTSTNDACVLISTGNSKVEYTKLPEHLQEKFKLTLNSVFIKLAQAIIRDGEGATKFVTVKIEEAKDENMAHDIAFAIANSPLVKTAIFASDPNWGRILAAAGRATSAPMDISKLSLFINELQVIKQGELADDYRENLGQKEMQQEELQIRLLLGAGDSEITVWTTDLSYDYVKINAEYRT